MQRTSLAGLFCLCVLAASLSRGAPPPNVLFILTDDLGWGDVGVFFQKQREVANVRSVPWMRTPHLDQLAVQGAQLPNHYCAAPVCAPSRASILTGVSQGQAAVRDNQFDKALENNHTLATVLRQAGYATVAVGKWGLQGGGEGRGSPEVWPAYPTKRGFDQFFGYIRHSDGHEHYPKEALYTKNGSAKQVWSDEKVITPELDKCYTADLWTAWAKHWITEHQRTNAAHPFFMYLAYDTPHAVQELPTQAYPEGGGMRGGLQWLGAPGHMINTATGKPDSWTHPDYAHATYDQDHNPATPEVPWPDVYKRYATSIRRLDDAVGDLIHLLQDLSIDSNTLVIFTSDNGPSIESYLPKEPLRANFFDSFGPFDGIKRDCWEGGERVPTLARWPGRILAGRVAAWPSISYDWMATLAEVAGEPLPARSDGVSLMADLTGQGKKPMERPLYVEYYESGKTPNYPQFAASHRGRTREQMQMIRLGDYVGVRYDIQAQSDPMEVYRVTDDLRESRDLAQEFPSLAAQMKTMTLQMRRPNASAPRPYDDEAVPALPADITSAPGLVWREYVGDFPWVPNLETRRESRNGVCRDIQSVPGNTGNGGAILLTGCIQVPRDGLYTFSLRADRGALLRLHEATVIDADFGYKKGTVVSGTIRLQRGLHPFRLYQVYGREKSLELFWSGPEMAKALIPASAFVHEPREAIVK